MEKLPNHLKSRYGTMRKFKQTKRAQLLEVEKALAELSTGCAYTPSYWSIDCMGIFLDKVKAGFSVKNWGR